MTDPRSSVRMQGERLSLWMIRHGETEWSAAGRHTGRTDIALTPDGERQSTALARHFNGRAFTLVLCSPLRRARETCRLAGYQDVANVTDDLLEWDYGAYEGRTTSEIRTEVPDWSIWTGPVPGGETIEEVSGRADRVIQRATASGGDVALFAHAHILRVVTARWLGLPPDAGRLFALSPASMSMLGYEREIPVVSLWNQSRSHA
jgi:broad specificity phosphatase PhoE